MPFLPADLFFLVDPQQRNALRHSPGDKHTWIYSSDTNKLIQVLIHMVLENLFAGKTTLITAGTEYERLVRYALDQLGLNHISVDLSGGVSNEAMAALQVARKKDVRAHREEMATLSLEKYDAWLNEIEDRHRAMGKPVFGEMSWKMVLDKAAIRSENAYKSILDASLSVTDFALSQQEYWHIRGRIKTFQRLRVLRTPAFELLDALAPGLFAAADGHEAKGAVMEKLAGTITRGKLLLKHIGSLMHQYRRDTTGSEYQVLQRMRHQIARVTDLTSEGQAKFGNGFLMESTFNEITFRIARNISKKSHELYTARSVLRSEFSALVDQFRGFHLYHSTLEDAHGEEILLEEIPARLEKIGRVIDGWIREIDVHASTRKRQLNARNISQGHVLGERLQAVEKDIDEFVQWVNAIGLFSARVEVNALSLEKSSVVIRALIQTCIRVREAMPEFEAYFLWRTFWEQLDSQTKALMEGLEIMEDREQIDSFEAWYFENILDQIPESELVQPGAPDQEFGARIGELREVLLDHIKGNQRFQRHGLLKKLRTTNKKLMQVIASGNRAALSEELRVLPAQTLAGLFPVVFCQPSHLRDYGYYFDELFAVDETGADCRAYRAQSRRCMLFAKSAPAIADLEKLQIQTVRMAIAGLQKPVPLSELPATDRLHACKALASQFAPFLRDLAVYHCKRVQVFSFLGDTLNGRLLEALGMPFKEVGSNGSISLPQITETLLDTRKPVVLLTRDGILGYNYSSGIFWQSDLRERLAASGLHVINTWSSLWRSEPSAQLEGVVRDILAHALQEDEQPQRSILSA